MLSQLPIRPNINYRRPMKGRVVKLSAYIIRSDSGFAPHPYRGLCSLACCKPTIRRCAEPGDIVIATGPKNSEATHEKLVYAMRVEEVIGFDEYWRRFPSRRPSSKSNVTARGDNIWHKVRGTWTAIAGGGHDQAQEQRDIRGENVLLSRNFYYFGARAIEVPDRYKFLLATTQGHRNCLDEQKIEAFWAWLAMTAPKAGRIGVPTFHERFATCKNCHDYDDDDVCEL